MAAGLLGLCAGGCSAPEPQLSFAYGPQLTRGLAASSAEWPAACERPPSERVGLPPALRREPQQRPVDAALVADLVHAVGQLREPFARLFQRHVCAVVLMHGAPMTGTLALVEGVADRGIILLNVDNLTPPNGDWLALKEATVFAPAPGRVLRGTMAWPDESPRRALLDFLLVHELAHVVENLHPDDPLISAFSRLSWPRRDGLALTPLVHYPGRLGKAPLPDELLEPYYDLIASSAFPSPAAIANAREDFADSVSTFMHTMQRGRPYRLDVYRNGRHSRQLNTCWEEARCAEKRRLLEALLQRWAKD